MLKTHQRLQLSRDMKSIYKYGKRCVAPHGVFFVYRKKKIPSPTQCAVVIGKKFSPKAVQRNHMRRIVQAALQKEYHHFAEGYDIVVGYTKKGQMVSYEDIRHDILFFVAQEIHP